MNDYKVVDATSFTTDAQLQAELISQRTTGYYYVSTSTIGAKVFLIFATPSISRLS